MLQTYTQIPMQCPGLLWRYPVAAFFVDPSEEDKTAFYDRLAAAVLLQALLDAGSKAADPVHVAAKAEARAWLLEEGATWAQLLGKNIRQRDINHLAANDWAGLNCTQHMAKRTGERGKKRGKDDQDMD